MSDPKKDPTSLPAKRGEEVVPKVEQPDPRSEQFQEEAQEEAEKEKLDP